MNPKKALKHDIEIAGKTIPTLALATLLLIGGGSAAVLQYTGQVTGTSQVDAALTMDNGVETQAEASYDDVVGGGEVTTEAHTLSNNADEAIPVSFTTNQRIQNDDSVVNANPNGVETSYLVYSQKESTANDVDSNGYTVDVSPTTENVQNGDYAVQISSGESTTDYATVWYSTDKELTSNHDLTVEGKSEGDVPAKDELYIITESGDKYYLGTGGDTPSQDADGDWTEFSYDLSRQLTSVEGETASIEDLNVAAIGLGYGNANPDEENPGRNVEVTIDNVRITDSEDKGYEQLSESGEVTDLPLTQTGSFEGFDLRHQFQSVTSFDNDFYTEGDNEVWIKNKVAMVE